MASITVVYSQSPSQREFYAFALKAEVTAAVGMPTEIFMFQRGVKAADGHIPEKDNYTCVCDPQDLYEIPAFCPDLTEEIPYYRTASVELWFRNTEDRDECQAWLIEDIQQLVTSLNALSTLTPVVTVTAS